MNKRITSLLLCFVMIVAMLATAVPTFAASTDSCVYTIEADKTTAHPGDTITFTIYMQQKGKMLGLEGELVIPAGLTFVANSGKLTDGIMTTLGWDDVEWYEPSMMLTGSGTEDYTSEEKLELMKFQCTVDSDVELKDYTVKLNEYLAANETGDPKEVSLIPATVTVTAAPKPATGISLNKSTLSLVAGSSEALTATVAPADTTDTVTWSSDKASVATVDSTGKVTAVAVGTAKITATAGTKTATCTVTVTCKHNFSTVVPEKASDCTNKGWDAYRVCSKCNEMQSPTGETLSGIPYRSLDADAHAYDATAWGYKGADGHAHVCKLNPAHHDTVVAHSPDSIEPTETEAVKCLNCGYVIAEATGHVHANHLTPVAAKAATCTEPGNKAYYECTCGKLFADGTANVEITAASVVLPASGHSYTVANSDAAHKRSTASDCRAYDTYWYTCANDASHSAKDDPNATDKFFNGDLGAHAYGTDWVDCGESGHAHKCQYHDVYDTVQAHTPDHRDGATYDYAVKCVDCDRELEAQLEDGTLRVELPFTLTVEKTGEKEPTAETFKFAASDFGAPTEINIVTETVNTDGAKTYTGSFVFTVKESQLGNLSEGFVFSQIKGTADGWTYDETKYYAVPQFSEDQTAVYVSGWTFFTLEDNASTDNAPLEKISFTNSYNAKADVVDPVTPTDPEETTKPEETTETEETTQAETTTEAEETTQTEKTTESTTAKSPKTGEDSSAILWVALLAAGGLTWVAFVSKKRKSNAK